MVVSGCKSEMIYIVRVMHEIYSTQTVFCPVHHTHNIWLRGWTLEIVAFFPCAQWIVDLLRAEWIRSKFCSLPLPSLTLDSWFQSWQWVLRYPWFRSYTCRKRNRFVIQVSPLDLGPWGLLGTIVSPGETWAFSHIVSPVILLGIKVVSATKGEF